MFLCMFGIFLCFLWGGLGSSWRISINIVGCVMEMTSVAIAGGDLGRGFFFFFPSSLCARGGCTDTEFKDANREKVETFFKKIFFYKNFPICMYSTSFPASKVRFTPFLNKTLI